MTNRELMMLILKGEAVYRWWINDTSIPGQMDIYSFLDNEDE